MAAAEILTKNFLELKMLPGQEKNYLEPKIPKKNFRGATGF